MPTIRLGRYEVETYALPPVCMRCGGPGVFYRTTKFSWHPAAIYAVLLFGFPGLLLYFVVAALFRKRMNMEVPLCKQHRNYWPNRSQIIYGSFIATFLLVFAALEARLLFKGTFTSDAWDLFLQGNFVLVFSYVTLAVAAEEKGEMRVREISKNSITFSGVSPGFIGALRRDQRGEVA
jgi:hypothetical protein